MPDEIKLPEIPAEGLKPCRNASPEALINKIVRMASTRQKLLGNEAYRAEEEENLRRLINERFVTKQNRERLKGTEKEQQLMFRAAEGILEMKNGKPVFGTNIKAKLDLSEIDFSNPRQLAKYEDRVKQLEEDGFKKLETTEDNVEVYVKPRYTPENAEMNYEKLSPKAKELVNEWVKSIEDAETLFNRNVIKEQFGIQGSNIEGYITHFGFEGGIVDKFKKIILKNRVASERKLRTEAAGFMEDFGKATGKSVLDLLNERDYNGMIKVLEDNLLEPLDDLNPLKPGYVEVRGSLKVGYPNEMRMMKENEFGETITFPVGKKKQIRADILEEFTSMRNAMVTADSWLKTLIHSLGQMATTNLLFQAGTMGTNVIGGALQLGAKIIEDFWKSVFLANPKYLVNDLIGILEAFSPKTISQLPAELWGGGTSNFYESLSNKTDVVSLFGAGGAGETKIGRAMKFGANILGTGTSEFFSFIWNPIENYFKRAIMSAELRNQGVSKKDFAEKFFMEGENLPGEARPTTELLLNINQIIDIYAFNYRNQPFWMSKWKRKYYAPWVKPFVSYPYNLVNKHYGHYFEGFNPKAKLSRADRIGRIMTLAVIASLILYIRNKNSEEKIGPHVEGIDYELDKGARLKIGSGVGGEYYMRTSKYPWWNLLSMMLGGKKVVEGVTRRDPLLADEGFSQMAEVVTDLVGGLGLGVQFGLHTLGYKNKYETYLDRKILMTQDIMTALIPRQIKSFADLMNVYKRKPEKITEAIKMYIPGVAEEEKGKIKTLKVPVGVDVNPSQRGMQTTIEIPVTKVKALELLKEWLGVNIKAIDPQIYMMFLRNKMNNDYNVLMDNKSEFKQKSKALDELIYLNTFFKSQELQVILDQQRDLRDKAREAGYD